MELFEIVLLIFLLICAVAVSLTRELLSAVLIYMAFSLVMSVIWILLQSPDLAITEAAVGAGITSILFFATLRKVNAITPKDEKKKKEDIFHNN